MSCSLISRLTDQGNDLDFDVDEDKARDEKLALAISPPIRTFAVKRRNL
jgi:hypothetical protein